LIEKLETCPNGCGSLEWAYDAQRCFLCGYDALDPGDALATIEGELKFWDTDGGFLPSAVEIGDQDLSVDRKSTRLNSSHVNTSHLRPSPPRRSSDLLIEKLETCPNGCGSLEWAYDAQRCFLCGYDALDPGDALATIEGELKFWDTDGGFLPSAVEIGDQDLS